MPSVPTCKMRVETTIKPSTTAFSRFVPYVNSGKCIPGQNRFVGAASCLVGK